MFVNQSVLRMLENNQIPERYQRNIAAIGIEGQKCLLGAKIAIVGAGGLGGTVVEILARQGVGCLRVIDGDNFLIQNLNRQLLATEKNLGVNKAYAAKKRIADINPDVFAEAVPLMLIDTNAEALLSGMDVIVAAVDNVGTRVLLGKTAQRLGLPLVHGAIAGFNGQVSTIMPGRAGLETLYKFDINEHTDDQMALGSPSTTPVIAAAIQAQEVVKLVTGIGDTLSGCLLYFNTKRNIYNVFSFE
jgi:molybdopterin-synthase adenylyltransferase